MTDKTKQTTTVSPKGLAYLSMLVAEVGMWRKFLADDGPRAPAIVLWEGGGCGLLLFLRPGEEQAVVEHLPCDETYRKVVALCARRSIPLWSIDGVNWDDPAATRAVEIWRESADKKPWSFADEWSSDGAENDGAPAHEKGRK